MHAWYPITALLVLASLGAGACGGDDPATPVPTTPAAERSQVQGGRIVVRGDFAPQRHGPFTLDGRYRVTFTQRGQGVDYAQEVPFTARLEQPAAGGPGKTIELFEEAAPTGTATVTATGRYEVVVDFGDSPYELVLDPR